MKKQFTKKDNGRKAATRNRRLAIEMKSLEGLMKFFQEEEPKKVANGR